MNKIQPTCIRLQEIMLENTKYNIVRVRILCNNIAKPEKQRESGLQGRGKKN